VVYMDFAMYWYFLLWLMFIRLFSGHPAGLTNSALPYLFCGTVILMLALVFFFSPAISGRNKLAAGAVLVVLVLSLWLSPLDKVWHLFKMPNWFPYRYSFVFSFFLVVLAGQVLAALPKSFTTWKLAPVVTLVLFCLTAWELGYNTQTTMLDIREVFHCQSYADYVSYYQENETLVEQA